MLLTQRMAEHYDDLADLFWFFNADNELVFTYDIDAKELWDDTDSQATMPVATPDTLEEARSIIESKGYTIA